MLKYDTYLTYNTYILIYHFTVAKPCKDPTKSPPITMLNVLELFCNRNNISFCIYKGAIYQSTVHLKRNYYKHIYIK